MTQWQGLTPGEALGGWAMSGPDERHYPGIARTMPDRVDYRFVNGWVNTGDLPCREALRAALPSRQVACPQGPFPDLVLALDGPEIDFSRFCHRPTLITRAGRCLIRGKGRARLVLGTCGGLRLWLDGQEVACFEPFTRNQPAHRTIDLELSGAAQELTLQLEDLHERDTTCFFSVVLSAGQEVATALPKGFDAGAVHEAATILAGLRTDQVAYHPGQTLRLVADTAPAHPLALRVTPPAPFGRGGLMSDPQGPQMIQAELAPDSVAIPLGQASDLPCGCLSIMVEIQLGGARLQRQLGTTVLDPGRPLNGGVQARKAALCRMIADSGGFEPSVALCMAALGQNPVRMARIIAEGLATIEARFDCSDFTILPLLRLYRDHGDDLPVALKDRMRAAFLNYRYWMDEPGDDVMWFWSENHVLCFHAAQLVAGQMFPDAVFSNSGLTGQQQAARAQGRLTRWFAAIEDDGLCEFNSAAYYPIDLLGLLTLHDMAPAFRGPAAQVLDRIFVMAALHSTGGVSAGVQGRCYEKELLAGPHTELGTVMALALGGAYAPGYDRAAGLLSLSDYDPPKGLSQLATPPRWQALRAAYTQGHGHAGRLTLWKTDQAQLSTVRVAAPGTKGHQAQLLDVHLANHPMARLWINHPGETRPWGERRPSLLAGSHVLPAVAQDGPVALMVFDLDRDWTDLRFSQLFAPLEGVGAPRRLGGWLIFADAVAVWCSSPLSVQTSGLYRGALWRAHATRAGWCVTLRLPGESATGFSARLGAMTPDFDPEQGLMRAVTPEGRVLALTATGDVSLDGQDLAFAPLDTLPHIGWDNGPLTAWKAPA